MPYLDLPDCKLHYKVDDHTDAWTRPDTVLFVHGFTENTEAWRAWVPHFSRRYRMVRIDQRGFGHAPQYGIWAGGDRMADDVWQVAQLVRERHPDIPLYGFGESMGGAVFLRALQRHPPGWVDAIVLSAPAVWSRDEMRMYQRMPLNALAHSWRGLKLSGSITGRKPSDNPATLQALREDPLVIHRTRVDVIFGLADLMDAVTLEPDAGHADARPLWST